MSPLNVELQTSFMSFRPAGEIFIHLIKLRFLPLVEMTRF